MLHRTGAIGATGSVERGSTVSDHDPLERRMQHSLNASIMHLTHADTRIHFIDTPGGADFLGQSLPALEAVESYMKARAATVFAPVLDYLREAGDVRSSRDIEDHFCKNFDVRGVTTACEYLADEELIGKASTAVHLTKRSNVTVEELALRKQDSFALLPTI